MRFLLTCLILSFVLLNSTTSYAIATPIMQGFTNETETEIILWRLRADKFKYFLQKPDGSSIPLTPSQEVSRQNTEGIIVKFLLNGLNKTQVYHFVVKSNDGREKVLDRREFRMIDRSSTKVRFAMVSCLSDIFNNQEKMWKVVLKKEPNAIFIVGDTTYTDIGGNGTVEAIWRRYSETRGTLWIFKSPRLVPLFAIWDDHDFGGNNVTSEFPLKAEVTETFMAFFGRAAISGIQNGPGISFGYEAFGHRFYFMDSRSYRTEGTQTAQHWGQSQETWLMNELTNHQIPTFLINGSQFFGGYLSKDSFESKQPNNFQSMLARLKATGTPVVFGSGDVHFSELMKIEDKLLGYETYELVSSSLHSYTLPLLDKRKKNPRRMDSTAKHNFLLVDSDVTSGDWSIDVKSIGARQAPLFQFQLKGPLVKKSKDLSRL